MQWVLEEQTRVAREEEARAQQRRNATELAEFPRGRAEDREAGPRDRAQAGQTSRGGHIFGGEQRGFSFKLLLKWTYTSLKRGFGTGKATKGGGEEFELRKVPCL